MIEDSHGTVPVNVTLLDLLMKQGLLMKFI